MRNKILISLLAMIGFSMAVDNAAYRRFHNQTSIGMGVESSSFSVTDSATPPNSATVKPTTTFVDINVERLFQSGVWADLDVQMLTSYSASKDDASKLGVNGNLAGVNAKVGYFFQPIHRHLALTPYALVGRNANLSDYTLAAVPANTNAISSQAYLTGGIGGQINFRVNDIFEFTFDQLVAINYDMSKYPAGTDNLTNYQSRTTLGARFNVVSNFQIKVDGYFDVYGGGKKDAKSNVAGIGRPFPQNAVGALVTVGLTY